MRREDLFEAIGMMEESRLARCENNRNPSLVTHREESNMKHGEYSANTKQKAMPRIWLIAAIVALILSLVGCAVAYVLSLDNMVLGTDFIEDRTGVTEPKTRLSLQGFVGSPSYQAAKEWYDFLQTYDPDNTISQSLSEENLLIPEEYREYNCYTPEMIAKVDEICQKYGLEKQGVAIIPTDAADFYEALQINHLIKVDAQAEVELSPQYFYKTGTFMLSCETKLTDASGLWPYPINYQYYCVMKTDLDDVYLSAVDTQTSDQWEYTTKDGVDLLLVIGETNSLLVADLENAFVTMNVLNAQAGDVLSGEQKMTRDVMMAFAETFDFSFNPQRPTQSQIDAINAKNEAYWAEIEAKQKEQEAKFQEYLGRASYAARVKFHLEKDTEATRMGYTFYDFDGNGVKELVIGRDGYIEYIYTEKDGETEAIIGWPKLGLGESYLATDGTLVEVSYGTYHFFHIENGEAIMDYWVEHRTYWGHSDESPWRLCDPVADEDRPITEEEYHEYRNSKERVVLEMLPLTAYPLSEPANYNTDGRDVTFYNPATSYEEMIRNYIINPVELHPGVFSEPKYVLLDLDHDGKEELIITEEEYRAVYTMTDGKLVCMYSGESYYGEGLNICRNNVIEIIHSYSGENKAYCYYRMSGTTGEMVEYLRYDAERNPQNPWFRSSDGSGQDISLEPITKAEFDRIRNTYAPLELDWKPITEYPLE